jgi:arylsulfatase A-like enzyme
VLRGAGYTTALITDLYHQFQPGKNFQRGFNAFHYIRGQEIDRYETGPRTGLNPFDYTHPAHQAGAALFIMQYLINRRNWTTEDDWPAAQVFDQAARWLDNNVAENQPFYLHLESYSPHEMWDPPDDYYRLYMKSEYTGHKLIYPPMFTAQMSPVEIEHVRALYAGTLTFVDARIGRLLSKVEELGLLSNTLIVFVADHGVMMGEQGQLRKGESRLRQQVTHIPLMIYYPDAAWAGRRVKGYVQHTDILPTILDILGIDIPVRVTGHSLRDVVESGGNSPREWIVLGWGDHASIRTWEWNCQLRWNPGPAFDELYDLTQDPLELRDVGPSRPDVMDFMRGFLVQYVDAGWAITRGSFSTLLS